MERVKSRFSGFEYKSMLAITLVFALIACILFLERSGIRYNYNTLTLNLMPAQFATPKAQALQQEEKHCLLIYKSDDPSSMAAYAEFEVILMDMKVGYDPIDLVKTSNYAFEPYETVVLLISNLSHLGEKIIELDEWVYAGGGALFPLTLEKEPYFAVMETKFGIGESSYSTTMVNSIYPTAGFMIGGGRGYEITDAFDSALALQLMDSPRVTVHAYTDDARQVPLVWESRYGEGKFVFDNFGIYVQAMRGFYAASYSLLGDVSVYPVINGSCFYLDDFPSQIPSGSNEYVWRDYGMTTREFYVNIWWPTMINFADRYGLKYTGLAIQTYDDAIDGTTTKLADKQTFLNFGNMLLRMGGEIGYHGYNHQPLALGNSDYKGFYDYKTWESEDAMKSGIDSLMDLCDELFPGVAMSVYVPPSNILSKEGEAFLTQTYPHITSISGTYFEEGDIDFNCTQEFDVTEEGIVYQPRIISGCDLSKFMELAAVSELNFHYVNSHFTHPDDALDPDRGAELGWAKLSERFDDYLSWLYTAAPNLRDLTGTEMAAAVQRFAALTISAEMDEQQMVIKLGNFYDEAQLMVRFNDRVPKDVSGGTLEPLTDSLYLLQANQAEVTIRFE